MSFGFSIGDFIAASNLVNKIRKGFVDAPSQFKVITDESLSIVLQDADVNFSDQPLNTDEKRELNDIDKGCRDLLNDLQQLLDKNSELEIGCGNASYRVRRLWKRLKWQPEDVNELRSRIIAQTGFLTSFSGRKTQTNVLKIVQHQGEEIRQGILEWIAPLDYTTQMSDILRGRQKGTCQWFLDSPRFKSWLEADKQTLFCPGIPGAGKTISTSIVVEELINRFGEDKSVGIAYLFCSFQRHDKQTIENLLSSLLRQFAESARPLSDIVTALHDRHWSRRTRPSTEELCRCLQSIITTYSRIFIIIDGLDECQTYNHLLSEVFSLQSNRTVQLFATSRFVPQITKKFVGDMSLEIRADDSDVRNYLDSHVLHLSSFIQRNSVLQEDIKTAIVTAVDGMFLLARLHLHSLSGKKSPRAVRKALMNLPSGSDAYDTAYAAAMRRIEGQGPDQAELAKQVLAWITCAKRPLTSYELRYALAVEIGDSVLDEDNLPDLEDLIMGCAGLVTVDEESDIVRLVHYTTQEYFNRTRDRWFPNAEAEMAIICVTYLAFDVESGQFLDYAAKNWGYHAYLASEETQTAQSLLNFLEDEVKVGNATRAMSTQFHYGRNTFLGAKALHLAAYFGLQYTVNTLLKNGHDVEARDADGLTPLMWAIDQGQGPVFEVLLSKSLIIDSHDKSGRTALHHAASLGQSESISQIIQRPVDLEARDLQGQTPLLVAVSCGHKEVVGILLDAGAKIDVCDNERKSALHLTVESEYFGTDIVELLLEHGAPSDLIDINNMTPLHCTIPYNRDNIVDLLLESGVTIDTRIRRRSWLRKLEDGADVYELEHGDGDQMCWASESRGLTPLHFAALVGDADMTKLFLSLGADPNARSHHGETPLHLALARTVQGSKYQDAWNENRWRVEDLWDIVEFHDEELQHDVAAQIIATRMTVIETLLADERIDVTLRDDQGATMLHNLNYRESWITPVVQALIHKGAETSVRNEKGQIALHLASRAGNHEVVAILIKGGADPKELDNDGRAAIHYAVRSHDMKTIEIILAAPDDNNSSILNTKDSQGRTALHHAVETSYYGAADVVRTLVNLGARADLTDDLGNSPLAHYLSQFRFSSDLDRLRTFQLR